MPDSKVPAAFRSSKLSQLTEQIDYITRHAPRPKFPITMGRDYHPEIKLTT
jgi:hypothetical protein